ACQGGGFAAGQGRRRLRHRRLSRCADRLPHLVRLDGGNGGSRKAHPVARLGVCRGKEGGVGLRKARAGDREMANQRLRSFAADTLALVIFFTVVSGLNERFIAGMSWPEVATSRSIGAVHMVLTA